MRKEILTTLLLLCMLFVALTPFVESVETGDNSPEFMGPDMEPPSYTLNYEEEGLYDGLINYDDVALIVNDNSEISREIGTYFAVRRGIPILNIINISVPNKETINFGEFDELARQVKENLSARNLTSKINFMVTTKGVPLRVTSGYYNMNDNRYYSSASVDSELMLLDGPYEGYIHSTGAFENPYAGQVTPFTREEFGMRLVTRLTGYTKEEAMGLVDLAEASFGVRGKAYLDMDPRRNSSGGYRQANNWMLNAYRWLRENGWPALLDGENQFITDLTNVSAYFSWGSNDGDWNRAQMSNGGFEYGTGGSPNSWIVDSDGGMALRTEDDSYSGSWSLMLQRTDPGLLRAYQDIPVNYMDHRYIADARYRLEGVTSPGARIILEGLDSTGTTVWTHTLANRTGTRAWAAYQDPIENETTVVTIRFIMELLGNGTVYFDNANMRVIRPHNQWIPGAIAETCVSTGGRSMTYGTWHGQSLVADLIHDGVTGVKGYTWEPFISAISHADILIPVYYYGFSLAESFWMGSVAASWMGTVIGDPKCTPYLNERADMGFTEEPLVALVDDQGTPYLQINLHNKGRRYVEEGQVTVFMDGYQIKEAAVSIGPSGFTTVNISSDEIPVQGRHLFRVVLNGDGNIWEFDQTNNEVELNITVNTVPELGLFLPGLEINRTESFVFNVSIEDPDMDFDPERLEVWLEDPYHVDHIPGIINVENEGAVYNVTFDFNVSWDMKLGSYSLFTRYVDGSNSSAEMDMKKRIRVSNALPMITGNISGSEFRRGEDVIVNISWFDPDTPSGELTLDVWAERTSGGSLPSTEMNRISNTSASVLFRLPVEDESQSWEIHVEATDRNGAVSSWQGLIRTYNGIPTLEIVEGEGQRITRIETAAFKLLYTDPEGLPTRSASMGLYGPIGHQAADMVWDMEMDLISSVPFTAEIMGNTLPVGNYSLTVSYRDDEGEGDTLIFEEFLEVYNIPPDVKVRSVEYDGVTGVVNPRVIKGDSVTVTIEVQDPDGPAWGLDINAALHNLQGSEIIDVNFDNAGQGEYVCRIQTALEWEITTYWLTVDVYDDAGANGSLLIEDLFTLDVDPPELVSGEVTIHYDGNVTVFAEFYPGRGNGLPDFVWIFLYDDDGREVMGIPLEAARGILYWEGSGRVTGDANFTTVKIMDNVGRVAYFNDTIDVIKEGPPVDIITPSTEDDDQTTLWLIIGIFSVLLIILVLALLMMLVLRSREKEVQPAPVIPMMGPYGGAPMLNAPTPTALPPGEAGTGERALPPSGERQALPPSGEAQQVLSPGRELGDGSLYHKPDKDIETGEIPPAQKAVSADIVPEPDPAGGQIPPPGMQAPPAGRPAVPESNNPFQNPAPADAEPPVISDPQRAVDEGAIQPPVMHE